jgi:hypothetical protein
MHWIVTGITGCGKSVMCKRIVIPMAQKSGKAVAVLDPILGGAGAAGMKEWGLRAGIDFLTDDPELYIETLKKSRGCVCIVDEWGYWRARPEAERIIAWVYTIGRNYGHLAFALAQRVMMVPPSVRSMCSNAAVFRQPLADLRDLADLLSEPGVMEASQLPQGVCIVSRPFVEPAKVRIFDAPRNTTRRNVTPRLKVKAPPPRCLP